MTHVGGARYCDEICFVHAGRRIIFASLGNRKKGMRAIFRSVSERAFQGDRRNGEFLPHAGGDFTDDVVECLLYFCECRM